MSANNDTVIGDPDAMDVDDDDLDEFAHQAFERRYVDDHSWEQLEEDEQGRLRLDQTAEQRAKRRRLLSAAQTARIRKGLIRYVQLVVDLSAAASQQDMRPSRMSVMLSTCKAFVREFFDQNPLSQLGIIAIRDGIAHRLTDLSGTPEAQIAKLSQAQTASGDASLQNALEMAVDALRSVPPYGHREVVMLFAALSTCDPGNVYEAVRACKDGRVRVSVVGVSAEVFVCKRMCQETGGEYSVALNEGHLQELMLALAPPPPAIANQATAELVHMGFPPRSSEDPTQAVFVGKDCILRPGSYTCPRCAARSAELPTQCHVCGLSLISSAQLARSYHHLFPVQPYDEVSESQLRSMSGCTAGEVHMARELWHEGESKPGPAGGAGAGSSNGQQQQTGLYCFGCLKELGGSSSDDAELAAGGVVLRCKQCNHLFCFECDTFVHESLHNCPGCECQQVVPEALE